MSSSSYLILLFIKIFLQISYKIKILGSLIIALGSIILLSLFIDGALPYPVPDGYTLEQLQVMFRHGDRVPERFEVYPKDPYKQLFTKLGNGQLTKVGMQREYKIGKVLRERYDKFLGYYKTNEVHAFSTDYDRTKISLQLVLAGLYPPSLETKWSDSINWSPIPTNYEPTDQNFLLMNSCPTYSDLKKNIDTSPEILSILENSKNACQYLEEKTGASINNLLDVVYLFQNIESVISMGLPIPNWCTDNIYEKLHDLSSSFYKTFTSTQQMTNIVAGPMIEQFLNNIKANGTSEKPRKVYVYSGHDFDIAVFSQAHNITGIPTPPEYGSTIVIEKLRGLDNGIYLRFFLWTGASEVWIPMKIEGCGYVCPLSIYEEIVKPIMPDKITRDCMTRSKNVQS